MCIQTSKVIYLGIRFAWEKKVLLSKLFTTCFTKNDRIWKSFLVKICGEDPALLYLISTYLHSLRKVNFMDFSRSAVLPALRATFMAFLDPSIYAIGMKNMATHSWRNVTIWSKSLKACWASNIHVALEIGKLTTSQKLFK